MYNNYLSEREQDLLERGGNQMVHDYDGTIKPLKSTKIWFNQDGYYIPPRNVDNQFNFCQKCSTEIYMFLQFVKDIIDCNK